MLPQQKAEALLSKHTGPVFVVGEYLTTDTRAFYLHQNDKGEWFSLVEEEPPTTGRAFQILPAGAWYRATTGEHLVAILALIHDFIERVEDLDRDEDSAYAQNARKLAASALASALFWHCEIRQ